MWEGGGEEGIDLRNIYELKQRSLDDQLDVEKRETGKSVAPQ